MALTLPQALTALDTAAPQASDLDGLFANQGLALSPGHREALLAQLRPVAEPSRGEPAAAWHRPDSLAALEAQLAQWDAEVADHAAEVARRRQQPYRWRLKNHLQDWWSWIRHEPSFWRTSVALIGAGGLFGGALGHEFGHTLVGAVSLGGLLPLMLLALLGHAARDGQAGLAELPDRAAERQALAPWSPSPEELVRYRAVPAVHYLAVSRMRSPIGLRQGDRAELEAAFQVGLNQDPDVILTHFLQGVGP